MRSVNVRCFIATLAVLSVGVLPADAATKNTARRAQLTNAIRALTVERAQVEQRLDRQRSLLAAVRTRRDEADAALQQAQAALSGHLVSIYRDPSPTGGAHIIANGVGNAVATTSRREAASKAQSGLVLRYRRAIAIRAAAEREMIEQGDVLRASAEELDVQRLDLTARLRAIPKPKALPVAARVSLPPGSFTPPSAPPATERGLPLQVLTGKLLPGSLSLDPRTGRPLLISPQSR